MTIQYLALDDVLALFEFLERNGNTITVSNDKIYQFTIEVATSVLDKEQVTDWVRARLQSIT